MKIYYSTNPRKYFLGELYPEDQYLHKGIPIDSIIEPASEKFNGKYSSVYFVSEK